MVFKYYFTFSRAQKLNCRKVRANTIDKI